MIIELVVVLGGLLTLAQFVALVHLWRYRRKWRRAHVEAVGMLKVYTPGKDGGLQESWLPLSKSIAQPATTSPSGEARFARREKTGA